MKSRAYDRSIAGEGNSGRLHFLDNLKTFTIFLVVFFHTAYAYSLYHSQGWYVVDPQHSLFFDVFILTAFTFMMPVMFFIAGYMGIGSLTRKGQGDFWRDKSVRIIAPWGLGVILLAPAIGYLHGLSRNIYPSYWQYWAQYFSGKEYQSHGQVHFYFLCVLILYYAVLSIAYRIYKPLTAARAPQKPSRINFVLFGLTTGIIFFCGNLLIDEGRWVKIAIFDLPATRFLPYMCYFLLGVFAYQRQWFTPSGYNPKLKSWAFLCLISFTFSMICLDKHLLPSGRVGLAFSNITYFFFCLTAVFSLLALFQKRLNFTTQALTTLAANSYGTYFIHYFIMLLIIITLRDLRWNVFMKWVLAGSLSAVASYFISRYFLSRTPLFGRNVKKSRMKPFYEKDRSTSITPIADFGISD